MKRWVNVFYDRKDIVKSLEIEETDIEVLLNAYAKEVKRVVLETLAIDLRDVYLITVVEQEEVDEQNDENTLVIDLRTYPEEMREQIRASWSLDPSEYYGGGDIG